MAATIMQRAKRTELIKFVEGSDVPLRKCHVHGFLPQSEFYDSSIRRSVYACKECTRKSRGTYHFTERGRDVYCAAEIRKREKIVFSPEQFSWSVKRWDNTCFLTGKTGREPTARVEGSNAPADSSPPSFTLIRADPSEVFSKNNSVLCCRALARTLAWQLPPHLLASYKARVAEDATTTVEVGTALEAVVVNGGATEPAATGVEVEVAAAKGVETSGYFAEPVSAETEIKDQPTAVDNAELVAVPHTCRISEPTAPELMGTGPSEATVENMVVPTTALEKSMAEPTGAPRGLHTKGSAPVKTAASLSDVLERGRQMLAKRKRAVLEAKLVVAGS